MTYMAMSPLLFVDDIVIFFGFIREQRSTEENMDIYCKATGTEINMTKSSTMLDEVSKGEKVQMVKLFQYGCLEFRPWVKAPTF